MYLTETEHKKLDKLAKASGYSRSAYMRKLLVEAAPPQVPPKEFYDFLKEINHIGVNINQIAKVANMTGHIMEDELKESYKFVRTVLSDIRAIYLGHRRTDHGNNEDMGYKK